MIFRLQAHLEEVVSENGHEIALLTAKHLLRCCKNALNDDQDRILYCGNNLTLTGTNYDSLSLKMEQTLSEVASLDSSPVLGDGTVIGGLGLDGGSISQKQLWNLQVHLWILIAELYIKLGMVCRVFLVLNCFLFAGMNL